MDASEMFTLDEQEQLRLATRTISSIEEADPVLRAVRRVESTPAWQAGLLDLVRLMVEGGESARRERR